MALGLAYNTKSSDQTVVRHEHFINKNIGISHNIFWLSQGILYLNNYALQF